MFCRFYFFQTLDKEIFVCILLLCTRNSFALFCFVFLICLFPFVDALVKEKGKDNGEPFSTLSKHYKSASNAVSTS